MVAPYSKRSYHQQKTAPHCLKSIARFSQFAIRNSQFDDSTVKAWLVAFKKYILETLPEVSRVYRQNLGLYKVWDGSTTRHIKEAMNCQKCRTPLKLDSSLQDLNAAAFDLLVGQ